MWFVSFVSFSLVRDVEELPETLARAEDVEGLVPPEDDPGWMREEQVAPRVLVGRSLDLERFAANVEARRDGRADEDDPVEALSLDLGRPTLSLDGVERVALSVLSAPAGVEVAPFVLAPEVADVEVE